MRWALERLQGLHGVPVRQGCVRVPGPCRSGSRSGRLDSRPLTERFGHQFSGRRARLRVGRPPCASRPLPSVRGLTSIRSLTSVRGFSRHPRVQRPCTLHVRTSSASSIHTWVHGSQTDTTWRVGRTATARTPGVVRGGAPLTGGHRLADRAPAPHPPLPARDFAGISGPGAGTVRAPGPSHRCPSRCSRRQGREEARWVELKEHCREHRTVRPR